MHRDAVDGVEQPYEPTGLRHRGVVGGEVGDGIRDLARGREQIEGTIDRVRGRGAHDRDTIEGIVAVEDVVGAGDENVPPRRGCSRVRGLRATAPARRRSPVADPLNGGLGSALAVTHCPRRAASAESPSAFVWTTNLPTQEGVAPWTQCPPTCWNRSMDTL